MNTSLTSAAIALCTQDLYRQILQDYNSSTVNRRCLLEWLTIATDGVSYVIFAVHLLSDFLFVSLSNIHGIFF
jgi:hypothetical protein